MTKRILQIYRINRDDTANAGVIKKCLAQYKAFNQHGYNADMLQLCNEGVLLNDHLIYRKTLQSHSLSMYWFYISSFPFVILQKVDFRQYDLIYLRHPFFDPSLVYMLRKIKRLNAGIKTVLEINTWPYDQEPKRWLHRMSLQMDRYYRRTAYRYIDAIVHYGDEKQIWNIPTIPIRNGIDVSAIRIAKAANHSSELRLIAVGNWCYWHGLDRLIRGLGNYAKQGKKTVKLVVVGEGPEWQNLRRLTKELNLERQVTFSGVAMGDKLDELFDGINIGIGTLAMHRKGVALDSSLKHREYAARGLPFVLSGQDPDFSESLPFIHYVPANEEAIDIQRLVNFQRGLKQEGRRSIRQYAEQWLGWEVQLVQVVRWFNKRSINN